MKAKLTQYDPNALRNRLPVTFDNAAVPATRFCAPRNEHTYKCVMPPSHSLRGPAMHDSALCCKSCSGAH